MSIAYLDPGNIESDLQSGAVAKFKVHCYSVYSYNMMRTLRSIMRTLMSQRHLKKKKKLSLVIIPSGSLCTLWMKYPKNKLILFHI